MRAVLYWIAALPSRARTELTRSILLAVALSLLAVASVCELILIPTFLLWLVWNQFVFKAVFGTLEIGFLQALCGYAFLAYCTLLIRFVFRGSEQKSEGKPHLRHSCQCS